MRDKKINIKLSKSEALILFEFVSRFTDNEKLEITDPAEERVLWDICSQLESILVEPLNENYAELLVKASKELPKEK